MNLSKGPYENHYYSLGEPIRNIVKQGQELLCKLGKQIASYEKWRVSDMGPDYDGDGHAYFYNTPAHQNWALGWWRTGAGIVVSEKPIGLPQSLGELCIEIAQDTMRQITIEYNTPPGFWRTWPTDLQTLRELLYHKNRVTS